MPLLYTFLVHYPIDSVVALSELDWEVSGVSPDDTNDFRNVTYKPSAFAGQYEIEFWECLDHKKAFDNGELKYILLFFMILHIYLKISQ